VTRDRSRDVPKSAVEMMAELRKDPEYADRMRRAEQQQRANAKQYRSDAEPILSDLAAIGYRIAAIGDLRRSGNYRAAIPVLLRWLPQVSNPQVEEDIVRTLSVPWAKPSAAPALIEAFKNVDDPTGTGLRWAIANALEVVSDDSVFAEVVSLVRDGKYGKAREMLALALANMDAVRSMPVLLDLLRDDQVAGHAVMALGRLAAPSAREHVARLLTHPTPWIRKEAKKALTKIERGPAK
jgi:hypothetical protein